MGGEGLDIRELGHAVMPFKGPEVALGLSRKRIEQHEDGILGNAGDRTHAAVRPELIAVGIAEDLDAVSVLELCHGPPARFSMVKPHDRTSSVLAWVGQRQQPWFWPSLFGIGRTMDLAGIGS